MTKYVTKDMQSYQPAEWSRAPLSKICTENELLQADLKKLSAHYVDESLRIIPTCSSTLIGVIAMDREKKTFLSAEIILIYCAVKFVSRDQGWKKLPQSRVKANVNCFITRVIVVTIKVHLHEVQQRLHAYLKETFLEQRNNVRLYETGL